MLYPRRKVLNGGGFVRLDYVAPTEPELQIVNSARVSYGKRHDSLDKSDRGLIGYLLRHRHGTPFEMVEFCFHVRCPIFVAREWHRHRISSYNELSGRYTKLDLGCYTPEPQQIRAQHGKPGHYYMAPIEEPSQLQEVSDTIRIALYNAEKAYNKLLEQGVAKELARIVLPVATYTEFYAKTNLRAWLNFISLRNDERALYEIRVYAQEIEKVLTKHVPTVMEHFIDNKRVAP